MLSLRHHTLFIVTPRRYALYANRDAPHIFTPIFRHYADGRHYTAPQIDIAAEAPLMLRYLRHGQIRHALRHSLIRRDSHDGTQRHAAAEYCRHATSEPLALAITPYATATPHV